MAWNYTEIEATTHKYHEALVNQIFDEDPVLAMLKDKKKVVEGGRNFNVPITVDELNGGAFGPNATFDIAKKETIQSVDVPVKGIYANLTLDKFDEIQNKGTAQIVNLIEEKLVELKNRIQTLLRHCLFDTAAAGMLEGVTKVIDDKNTYAGLNRADSDKAFWRSQVVEDKTGTAPIVLSYAVLRDFHARVSRNSTDNKNLIFVGDRKTISLIEDILIKQNTINSRDNVAANLGFENFSLFNKKVYVSEELDEIATKDGKGILYAINFDYFQLYTLEGADFFMTEFKKDRNSEMRSKQMLVAGNFVSKKPKRLGKITSIKID